MLDRIGSPMRMTTRICPREIEFGSFPSNTQKGLDVFNMRRVIVTLLTSLLLRAASRPPDIRFEQHMIDPGPSETAAVGDINKDGYLDIVSSESWYEGPTWKKHPLRPI